MNQAKLYLITEENKNCFSSMEIQNLKSSVYFILHFPSAFSANKQKITIESKKRSESKQIRVIKSLIVFFFFLP